MRRHHLCRPSRRPRSQRDELLQQQHWLRSRLQHRRRLHLCSKPVTVDIMDSINTARRNLGLGPSCVMYRLREKKGFPNGLYLSHFFIAFLCIMTWEAWGWVGRPSFGYPFGLAKVVYCHNQARFCICIYTSQRFVLQRLFFSFYRAPVWL